jgi:hypothetical protein
MINVGRQLKRQADSCGTCAVPVLLSTRSLALTIFSLYEVESVQVDLHWTQSVWLTGHRPTMLDIGGVASQTPPELVSQNRQSAKTRKRSRAHALNFIMITGTGHDCSVDNALKGPLVLRVTCMVKKMHSSSLACSWATACLLVSSSHFESPRS